MWAAEKPTMYFIGVTTGRSSIRPVFPLWAEALGLDDVALVGIDLPPHAPAEEYRKVVDFLGADPLSLGALVTTHKIDLYQACRDLFDEVDPFAALMGEVSSLSKRDGRLIGHAKDPIAAGLALDAFLPAGFWSGGGVDPEALLLGSGGAAIAIAWYLAQPERGADRPARITLTDVAADRLATARRVVPECRAVPAEDNAKLLAELPPGSLVVNATGLGKDAPGSPLPDGARWPAGAVAWELNYRGDLVFAEQARRAGARVEDGWVYFLHGWTQVIAEVFDREICAAQFAELARIAAAVRG